MKLNFCCLIFCCVNLFLFAMTGKPDTFEEILFEEEIPEPVKHEPDELEIFKQAYKDVKFESIYIEEKDDFLITVTLEHKNPKEFYWASGKFLPEEELENADTYGSLLYKYPKELIDPVNFTQEEKDRLKEYGSVKNRRNSAGTPMFLFDYFYDAYSEGKIEPHIKRITFLGHWTRVHERVLPQIRKVEAEIRELSKKDEEVLNFVQKIKSSDAFYWRLIDGTNRKSFHALGIAIDILPVRITGEIFWSWARDKNPNAWMLTPLKRRWIPPRKVIDIFEANGFIWGGKWAIWDNMHFEYHPELLILQKMNEETNQE